ncbi:MAG: FadR family transcriptional regulator [Gemmatimonadetes bacterium]|nr:FadR family transcriptional regulator [Gemmatimonadota bacterium]
MSDVFAPVLRQSLTDDLAQRIRQLIETSGYGAGDRLPTIAEMARRFGVGHPTLREALKKLETLGVLDIRHGSGVYVGKNHNTLLVSNPVFVGSVSRKLLVDLIEARIPIELKSVSLAAEHATGEHLGEMRSLLAHAEENLEDDDVLSATNMAFHRQIALASGNTVLAQLLEVLSSLFQQEQRLILDIFGSRRKDHFEHVGILQALEDRDPALAVTRMRSHLEGVREVLLKWDPNATPVR